jgi:hypothetical protein
MPLRACAVWCRSRDRWPCLDRHRCHSREHHGTAIRISQDDEPAPGCLLGWPQDCEPMFVCLALARVWIVNGEAHRGAAYSSSSREGASLIVAPVVAVEYNPSWLASDHDGDLVFEEHRQPERIGIERPRLAEVRNVQDHTLKVSGLHEITLARRVTLSDGAPVRQPDFVIL